MNRIARMMLTGGGAGFAGAMGLDYILSHVASKAAIIQTTLEKAPQVTRQVYESAYQAAPGILGADASLVSGLLQCTAAGILAAATLYLASKKD